MIVQTILWHRLDLPGHEAARLEFADSQWHLHGTAVFAHRGGPCCVEYTVRCDAQWKTRSGTVRGWVGCEPVAVEIAADP